eukprot:TRINITY_DN2490_c0_g1_i1.p1 TRINITY_DN2490_c0_g1~~TRINITY_DN2490_c0_g1_i1.p1  ORF type:complete len:130 (-),score=13.21 TRINITY_DN2490_c0_g1_i1:138-527(-)
MCTSKTLTASFMTTVHCVQVDILRKKNERYSQATMAQWAKSTDSSTQKNFCQMHYTDRKMTPDECRTAGELAVEIAAVRDTLSSLEEFPDKSHLFMAKFYWDLSVYYFFLATIRNRNKLSQRERKRLAL